MAQISFNAPRNSALISSKSALWDAGYTYAISTSSNLLELQSSSGTWNTAFSYSISTSSNLLTLQSLSGSASVSNTAFSYITATSANLLSLQSASGIWDVTHAWVTAFSADPTLDTLHISNSAYIHKLGVNTHAPAYHLHVVGDTLVEGNLTATGILSYKNTEFTTFTALSVDNGGTTTSLFVKQRGNFGIAEFRDGDETAMYIDGHSDRPGYVGIKTVEPNVELTVKGRISASEFIFSPNILALQDISGTNSLIQTNSSYWDLAYTYANSTSANLAALQDISGTNSLIQTNSSYWDSAYTYANSTSANLVSLQDISGTNSTVKSNSSYWDLGYTYANSTSANLVNLQTNSSYWDLAYTYANSTSANLAALQDISGTNSLIQTNSSYWDSAYTYANSTSANLAALQVISGAGTLVQVSSSYWDLAYTYANSTSANLAALQDISGAGTLVQVNSSYWDSAYTYANSTSANLAALQDISGTNSLIQTNSSYWDSAYTYANSTSANLLILQNLSGDTPVGVSALQEASGSWNTAYTYIVNNSSNLADISGKSIAAYNWVTAFSADPTLETLHITNSAYIQNKLGIGVQSPLWPLHVVGNTLVEGNLTATGTITYLNTDTTTFTALSVDNGGTVTSLFVKQRGNFGIAEFKDGEDTAMYIDGHSDRPGYVGVKTVEPNVELAVVGRISASEFIFSPNILALQDISGTGTLVQTSSSYWDSAYTYANTTSANLVDLQSVSGVWNTAHSYVTGTSANLLILQSLTSTLTTTHSWVTAFSADPTLETLHITNSAFVQNKLGVGLQAPLYPLHVVGNTLVEGNLTATGTIHYLNTETTTFTALSVDNGGTANTLFVKQRGNFGIAEFRDGEDIAMYIDGHSDRPGFVGIKTVQPNVELTVKGRISASEFIFSPNISELQNLSGAGTLVCSNSSIWNTGYTFATTASSAILSVQSGSARWESAYSYSNSSSANLLLLQGSSALWNSAHSYVSSASANLGRLQSLSSSWNTAYNYVTATSANLLILQRLSGIGDSLQALSSNVVVLQSNSANWESTYSTTKSTSGNLVALQAASSTWSDAVISFTIDGGGSSITTGKKGTVVIPNNFTITEWTIVANIVSITTVDVLSGTVSSYPSVASITQTDPITLNSQIARRASVNWGPIQTGIILEFEVTGNTNASLVTVSLKGRKS